ncbi:MAG TPA: DUF4416 family protein [Fibrobacteria bacterium]|nr:DUF4416 family protein [Fibrobacteria bacterium]
MEPSLTLDRAPPKCKWVMAVLGPSPRPPEEVFVGLAKSFSDIDFKGEFLPFDTTDYYADEFGRALARGFLSFRGLGNPADLPAMKQKAAALEGEWAKEGRRVWNLDIGYMDPDKVVLASYKRGPCKLYLGNGVYADFLLKYAKGRFEPLPWAFADFRDGRYHKGLLAIREKMKAESHRTAAERSGSSL